MKDTNFNSITLFISSVISILALAMCINLFQILDTLNTDITNLKKQIHYMEHNVKTHDRILNEYPNDDINKYDNTLEDLYEGDIENKK